MTNISDLERVRGKGRRLPLGQLHNSGSKMESVFVALNLEKLYTFYVLGPEIIRLTRKY